MQEELLAYEREEIAYQEKLNSLRQVINQKDLSTTQLNEYLDVVLYMFETEALTINADKNILYTEKYEDFKKNYIEKNYLTSTIINLKQENTENKSTETISTTKNNILTITDFRTTVFPKTLKDFINEAQIKTYAERINHKNNKVERTMLIRAGKTTETYFIKILYEYFVMEVNKDVDKFLQFYNDLVEATKHYYNSVEYCVTIGNFFSEKEDLWFIVYQDYIAKKLNNSDTMGAKYEWD